MDPFLNEKRIIGHYKWGVYAFYDYDHEPIYVGQTNEQLSTRIRRHLTNQRTDAVAMSVLDPYEVCYIEVWPISGLRAKTTRLKLQSKNNIQFHQSLMKREVKWFIYTITCQRTKMPLMRT